ncbi:hypothetical protein H4Q26_006394 [Puccinia striiformis f. sp. tritici PST-130]|nr:hypothetical protein H4Q26_006394 [Puccinia striiformis f. sp. tritici PST-130]
MMRKRRLMTTATFSAPCVRKSHSLQSLAQLLSRDQCDLHTGLNHSPVLAIYGAITTPLYRSTLAWSIIYYYFTGLGITAGYHRLWAHRSYNASLPLQYFLALGGSGAVEAHKGLLWSHVGWMVVKPRRKPGVADVSDLSRNQVVRWQHRWYLPLIFGMGFLFPTMVAGLGWNDWRGGFFYAGAADCCSFTTRLSA